jgi:hypothetical protein
MNKNLRKYWPTILIAVLILAAVALIEYHSGRSPLGPDGKFGWWDSDVWSSENSQRVADAYSFSHIIHGILFYAFLWFINRLLPMVVPARFRDRFRDRFPLRYRLIVAMFIEAGWELLENSPLIINRYREATIALGYVGDSILNSVSDVVMMMLGFLIARLSKIWVSILLIIVLELGCLFWVRDNLTLNVLMLVHPVQSVKIWQSEGH